MALVWVWGKSGNPSGHCGRLSHGRVLISHPGARLALMRASSTCASENSRAIAAAVSRKRPGSMTLGCSGQETWTNAGMSAGSDQLDGDRFVR